MLGDIIKALSFKEGLVFLVGVVCGLAIGWFVALPRMVEDRVAVLNEQKKDLATKYAGTLNEIEGYKKEIEGYQAEISELEFRLEEALVELFGREIKSVIFQDHGERKAILEHLYLETYGAPLVDDDGSFSVTFTSDQLFGIRAATFKTKEPFNFEHDGRLYHFIVEPLPEHDIDRAKVSVYTGPGPKQD